MSSFIPGVGFHSGMLQRLSGNFTSFFAAGLLKRLEPSYLIAQVPFINVKTTSKSNVSHETSENWPGFSGSDSNAPQT